MATTEPVPRASATGTFVRAARGGVSGGAVLTGVVVAFGAMSVLSAVIVGVASIGLPEDTPFPGTEVQGTLFAGIVLSLTMLVAYMWGGYTAGRMARGAGLANGLLVPLVAFLLVAVVGAVVATVGSTEPGLTLPFQRYPIGGEVVVTWGPVIGITSVLAMFVGGGIGGLLGARWHARLERDAGAEGIKTGTSEGSSTTTKET